MLNSHPCFVSFFSNIFFSLRCDRQLDDCFNYDCAAYFNIASQVKKVSTGLLDLN